MSEQWENEGGLVDELANTRKFVEDLKEAMEPVDNPLNDIRDILMLQTALLMRLYDVNMRILENVNDDEAAALWDLHEKGGHENPPTMVPRFEVKNEED